MTMETDRPPIPATPRLASVDLLRGVVMILMVLDHTREFFSDLRIDPTDLSRTTPALFFTRWITHFCAPTFVFLAGTGAFLAESRGKSRRDLAVFLLTRGLWLIVLDQIWGIFGFVLGLPVGIKAIVLWAIGWSMIALSALIHLPKWAIAALGVAMIATHNLLDSVASPESGLASIVWHILHQPGLVPLGGGQTLLVLYPLIPWIGVLACGYAIGPVLLLGENRRRSTLLGIGLALTLGFVALRALNVYGDPRPWTAQSGPIGSVMSFLNCQKYPPSLLFLLMTLGPSILALSLLDRGLGHLEGPIRVFGRVPLFYYLLQWPLLLALTALASLLLRRSIGVLAGPPGASGHYFGLPMVYVMWIVAVALLYLPCRWFAGVKRRRSDAWLSYF